MGKEEILEFEVTQGNAKVDKGYVKIIFPDGSTEFAPIVGGDRAYKVEVSVPVPSFLIVKEANCSWRNRYVYFHLYWYDGNLNLIATIDIYNGRVKDMKAYKFGGNEVDEELTKQMKLIYAKQESNRVENTLIEVAKIVKPEYFQEEETEDDKKRNYWVNGKLVMIRTDAIIVPEWARETERDYLEESVKAREIIVPLIVGRIRPPEGAPEYILIDGKGRLDLAKKLGIKEVPCRLVDINSEEEALLLALELEETKKPWSLQYTLNVLKRLLDMGLSKQEIAEKLKISKSTLYRLLWLLEFPDDIKNLFISGALGLRNADIVHKALEVVGKDVVERYFEEYENIADGVKALDELVKALTELKEKHSEYEFKVDPATLSVEIYKNNKKVDSTLGSVIYSSKAEIIRDVGEILEAYSEEGEETTEEIEELEEKEEETEIEEKEFFAPSEDQVKEMKQALRKVFPRGTKVQIHVSEWGNIYIKDKDTGMTIVEKRGISKEDYVDITMNPDTWVKKNIKPLILQLSRIISILKTLGYDTKPLEEFFNRYFASS